MLYFKNTEIRNLIKLRIIALLVLAALNFLILGIFLTAFYSVYQERNLGVNFVSYVLPTIAGIQGVLLLFFAPLSIVIFNRFERAINEIFDLDDYYLALYKKYTLKITRPFSTIPDFLFSQKGLLVNTNTKVVVLTKSNFNTVKIRKVDLGRFGKKCYVYFYHNELLRTKIIYNSHNPDEVGFLKEHINLVNDAVLFEEL